MYRFCAKNNMAFTLTEAANLFLPNQRGQCDVLLLDFKFSKEFDKVHNICLCHKLYQYGIHCTLLSWLQLFYTTNPSM